MTIDEFYGQLRSHGYTKFKLVEVGKPRTWLLQCRDGEFLTIPAAEDMDAAPRSEELERFLRINCL